MNKLKEENIVLSRELDQSKCVWEKIIHAVNDVRNKVGKCKTMNQETEARNEELINRLKELHEMRKKDKENYAKLEACLRESREEKYQATLENTKLKAYLERIREKYVDSHKCLSDLKSKLEKKTEETNQCEELGDVKNSEHLGSLEERLLKKYQREFKRNESRQIKIHIKLFVSAKLKRIQLNPGHVVIL
ncbi:hypothetical protein WDU94_004622 [Cyamophila willieti]